MADFTLADYLQGRRNPLLDQWSATPPADLGGDPTPLQNALIPTGGKGSVQRIHYEAPLGQSNLLSRLVGSVGQPSYDMMVADREAFRRTGQVPERGFTELMSTMPMGPFGTVRTPVRIPNPIRAYHGSPHAFDEFRMDRVNTGEGAQAYGHGLYFAEAEPVAQLYRHTHSSIGMPISPPPGHMYEVNIHARPEQFLDWDRPLAQQPREVLDALGLRLASTNGRWNLWESNWRGQRDVGEVGQRTSIPTTMIGRRVLRDDLDTPEGAAALVNAGVPGVRYFDAGSRGTGQGTSNLVVFDPSLIEILRRYGTAAPVAGGAAASMLGGGNQPQY